MKGNNIVYLSDNGVESRVIKRKMNMNIRKNILQMK